MPSLHGRLRHFPGAIVDLTDPRITRPTRWAATSSCSSGMTVLVMHPYHPWVMHPYHPMPLSAACGTTLSVLVLQRVMGGTIALAAQRQGRREAPLAEVRFVPRIYAALAYLVQFLVKRRLLTFDRAISTTDCVVDGIVQFAQILGGHFL